MVTVGGDRGDRIGDEASKKAAKEKERKRQQRVKLSTAAMARAACRVNDSCGDGDSGNKQKYATTAARRGIGGGSVVMVTATESAKKASKEAAKQAAKEAAKETMATESAMRRQRRQQRRRRKGAKKAAAGEVINSCNGAGSVQS